jgi:hypothetical protein
MCDPKIRKADSLDIPQVTCVLVSAEKWPGFSIFAHAQWLNLGLGQFVDRQLS